MSATNPENGTVSYTYNSDGTLLSRTDANLHVVQYSYDKVDIYLTQVPPTGCGSSAWPSRRQSRT
jgi:YD repeat-containing protein